MGLLLANTLCMVGWQTNFVHGVLYFMPKKSCPFSYRNSLRRMEKRSRLAEIISKPYHVSEIIMEGSDPSRKKIVYMGKNSLLLIPVIFPKQKCACLFSGLTLM